MDKKKEPNQKSQRESRREQVRRRQLRKYITWIVVGVIAIGALSYVLWVSVRPLTGESVEIMTDSGHVEIGDDPGPYNSNPPSSGRHYASEYEAGFYEETSTEAQQPYPEGFLVHNLEHGYVIFWYNCELLDEDGCVDMKGQIRSAMEKANNFKVIAFPRKSIDVPLVMTSWGQVERFVSFNPEQAGRFISRNRNHAPEPDAP